MHRWLFILLGLLPIQAMALQYGDFYYRVTSSNTVEITDYTRSGTNAVIPSAIAGNRVASIGRSAFQGCTNLTSITIPDSVTSIGRMAFGSCSKLTSMNVDTNNMTYSSLSGVLYDKNQTYIIRCPATKEGVFSLPASVTTIAEGAFLGCSGLTSITIPDGVASIGSGAFYGCKGLTSITMPDSVASIGNAAFYGCSGLTSITIPASVTTIGDYAFTHCKGLTSITIPDSVTNIGDEAFHGCSGLTSIPKQRFGTGKR
jgi:hypothetical protein